MESNSEITQMEQNMKVESSPSFTNESDKNETTSELQDIVNRMENSKNPTMGLNPDRDNLIDFKMVMTISLRTYRKCANTDHS